MTAHDTAAHPSRKQRPLRSLYDVNAAEPAVLAMMTRAQVDALSLAARERRIERILADTETLWVIADIAEYFRASVATIRTWRWRTGKERFEDSDAPSLPEPLPELRRGGRGRPQPQWRMSDIVRLAPEIDRADRFDHVTFPRRRPGRTPDAVRLVAPAQRKAPSDDLAAVA